MSQIRAVPNSELFDLIPNSESFYEIPAIPAVDVDVNIVNPSNPVTRRKTIKFSGRKLVGSCTLYSKTGMPLDGVNGSLVGVIVQCPNKKSNNGNNGRYKIDWEMHSIGMPASVIKEQLRQWYANDNRTKEQLKAAMLHYDTLDPSGVAQILEISFPVTGSVPTSNVPIAAARPATATAFQETIPATPVRMLARSALMTAAECSVSTRSHRQSTYSRSMRSATSMQESKSEDGTLDPDDDAWVPIPEEIDIELGHDSDEDSLFHDVPRDPALPLEGLADLLKKLQWNFEEVEGGAILENVPDLYEGPTGLRPGVTFSNPMDCLQKAGGLTEKFVQKLCVESNQYFKEFIKPNLDRNLRYCGDNWENIKPWEMNRFLGIVLRISMEGH